MTIIIPYWLFWTLIGIIGTLLLAYILFWAYIGWSTFGRKSK